MRTRTILHGAISAALIALGCAASAATKPPSDDGLPGRCEGPACTRVATPVDWPDVRVEEDSVYFADAGMADTSGDIEIVHRRIKDAYVFVQFKGFSFDDVRRVVGSLESTRD